MPSYRDIFPDKWLHADVINGHRPRVVIEHVGIEQLFNPRTKKHEAKLVVKFHKKELRLICNKTQATALATICKSDDYTRWPGSEVVLSTGKAPNGMDTILISPVPDGSALLTTGAPPASSAPMAEPVSPAPQDDLAGQADDITDFDAADDALWEPTSRGKPRDTLSPAQLLRLTVLMADVHGKDWKAQEKPHALAASDNHADGFSELSISQAEVLIRQLEKALKKKIN